MNCFHGSSIVFKGIAAQFPTCEMLTWAYQAEKYPFPPSRNCQCLGKEYWNVEKYIPIPDCFFPPNETLLFKHIILIYPYLWDWKQIHWNWWDKKNPCEYATHGANFQRRWNTHALICVILQLSEMRSKKDWWMKTSPTYLNEGQPQDIKLCHCPMPQLHAQF